MITTDELSYEEEMPATRANGESVQVQLARIEQRLSDHEDHDKNFRQISMWCAGIFVAILVGIIGTMWSDINRIDGRQQVVLSTVTDIRGQLTEIKDDMKGIKSDLKEHMTR